MGTDREARLLDLAGDIADDVEIDWENQDGGQSLDTLREIEGLANAFRTLRSQATDDGDDSASSSAVLFTWGQFDVLEKIDDGSFGEVYRAWDPVLDREVALKLRRLGPGRSPGSRRRYIAEARRLATIHHNNVVVVHGADFHDDRVGLWTELVKGRTLERVIEEDGLMEPVEAVLVGLELCRALAAVHGAGLVHGDVKAANVIREQRGRLVLADLGAATEIAMADNPGIGVTLSPLTTAPEILEGSPPGPESDLYSLGVLLFFLLSNRYPVEGQDLNALHEAHRSGARRSLGDLRPDLRKDLIRVVERATASDPGERYASLGAMERDLNLVLRQSLGIGEVSTTAVKRSSLRPWLLVATASAIIGLGLAAIYIARTLGQPAPFVTDIPVPATHLDRDPGLASGAIHVPPSLGTEIALFRQRGGSMEAVSSGGSIVPGDRLFVELKIDHPMRLYLVEEDRDGAFLVLVPSANADTVNPLAISTYFCLPESSRPEVETSLEPVSGGARQ